MTSAQDRLYVRPGLRAVLIVLLGFGVVCASLFSMPYYAAVPALFLLTVAVPAGLTSGVIYLRGAWRAFCMGGLFPSGLSLYATGWMLGLSLMEGPGRIRIGTDWITFLDRFGPQYRAYAVVSWAMTIAIGTMFMFIRHLAGKRRRELE